jgi:hypothetical protein
MQDVAISEDNLKGEALVDRSTKSLRRFPEGELPVLPEERFNALWAAQPRWPAEDIEPYVESLQVRLPACSGQLRVDLPDKGKHMKRNSAHTWPGGLV